jgi:hypothetical protein
LNGGPRLSRGEQACLRYASEIVAASAPRDGGGHRRDAASWSAKGRLGLAPAHAIHVTAIESGNLVDEWGIAAPGRAAEPPRHRQAKGAGTDMLGLTPPRHTSTLPTAVVRFAQLPDIPGRRGKRVKSTPNGA